MDGTGTRTWEIHDALGSVRQTLDDAATPLGSASYTPFGVPQTSTPDPFGFTGELHAQDLVYLRARWYDPSSGGFVGRDPFAGFPETPYSLHPYQYGYSNPVLWRDASGRYPTCRQNPEFGNCVWGHPGRISGYESGGKYGIATYQQVCFSRVGIVDDGSACTDKHMSYVRFASPVREDGLPVYLYRLRVWENGEMKETYTWSDNTELDDFKTNANNAQAATSQIALSAIATVASGLYTGCYCYSAIYVTGVTAPATGPIGIAFGLKAGTECIASGLATFGLIVATMENIANYRAAVAGAISTFKNIQDTDPWGGLPNCREQW